MKKILKSFALIAAAATAFVSCQTKELKPDIETTGKVVYFGTELSEVTKATLTPDDDDANFEAAWEDNDAMKVACFMENVYMGDFDAIWNGNTFASTNASDFFDVECDFLAVYPAYDDKGDILFGSERVQNGNEYNGTYDVMLSQKKTMILEEGKTFIFNMDRQTAIAYFHLTSSLPSNEKVVSATLSVNEDELAGSINFNEGTFTPEKSANSITLTFTDAPSIDDLQLWFNVFPGTYSGLKLEVETENHTLTIQNSKSVTYEAGKLYKVVANATAKYEEKEDPDGDRFIKVASDCADWAGHYLIVYENDGKMLAFNSSLSDLDVVKNTVEVTADENGDITFDENTAKLVFEIEKMTGGYSIKASNGKYIYGTSGSNKLNANQTASANTITWKSDKNYLEIAAPTYLTFNATSGQERFRYMKTDNENTSLYRLNGNFNPDFPTLVVVDKEIASNTLNVSVPVTSNRNWTAEITEGSDLVENGVLSTAAGSGDGAIEFKFKSANKSISETQLVKIHVVADTKEADITITHKTLGAQLNLEKSEDNIAADATEYTVNITSANFDWNVLSYTIANEEQTITEENCTKNINQDFSGSVTIKFSSNKANPSATTARDIKVTIGYTDIIDKTINITQAGDAPQQTDGWIEKPFTDITSDDVFVITSDGYALSSANGTSSSPAAVEVTIMGNAITSDVTDALKWTVTGDATNGYSFLANGDSDKKLFVNTTASTKDNDKVRVGTGERCIFSIHTNTSEGVHTFKTKDSYTARYISLYNNTDWRDYVSDTQAKTNLKFYVFNDSRQPQPNFRFSASAGSYDLFTKVSSYPTLEGALTTVTYQSSDESVATVDNDGTIHPIKVGSTVITASTAENDPSYKPATDSYTLIITDSTPILTLNVNEVNVSADDIPNATIPNAYSLQNATDGDVTVGKDGNITEAYINGGTVTYSIKANETESTVQSHITLTLNSVSHTITVNQLGAGAAPTIENIFVSKNPKIIYSENEYFNPAGLEITLNMSDASSSVVKYDEHSSDFTFNPGLSTKLQTTHTSVELTYLNVHSTSITIQVQSAKQKFDEIFNFKASNILNLPTSKNLSAAGDYSATINNRTYKFTVSKSGDGVYYAGTAPTSAYLMVASGNTIALPAFDGYKLVKIIGTLNSSGTPSTASKVSIIDSSGNVVTGGTETQWSTKGGNYTYTLTGTSANTVYTIKVANKNLQCEKLQLFYEPAN